MSSLYYDDGTGAAAAAALGLLAVFLFIVAIAGYVLSSLFLMKIFDKAGVEGKWRAWIPIYNSMVFLKLGDLSPWLILYCIGGAALLSWIGIGFLFSAAAAVLMVLAAYRVGQKLQKDGAWVVLYIFLSIVWLGIAAFDKSRWNTQIPPAPWAGNAFFGDRTAWDGIPVQTSASAAPGYGAASGYGAGQGYGAPQGYQSPAAPGYQPPAAPGYQQPVNPGYQPPASPMSPPAAPNTPPAAPAAPPAAPTTPPVPPVPPADPEQPPA